MKRTAVVTGGAGGIGDAIVRALRDAEHDVAILDREGEFLASDGAATVTGQTLCADGGSVFS